VTGNGGNIIIKSDYIFGLNSETKLTPFSDITASSELGIDGTVKIFSPESNAGEEIVIAGRENRSINGRDLVSKKCTVYGEKASVVQDLGYGIPPNPLDSPYTEGLPTIEETAKSSQTSSQFQQEDSIVEANQIKVLPNGQIFFVAGTQSHQSLTEPDICSRD
jgi:large exoprotein involved in heme utilization and adhesion